MNDLECLKTQMHDAIKTLDSDISDDEYLTTLELAGQLHDKIVEFKEKKRLESVLAPVIKGVSPDLDYTSE